VAQGEAKCPTTPTAGQQNFDGSKTLTCGDIYSALLIHKLESSVVLRFAPAALRYQPASKID
jgi:hypothetical protein